MTTPGTTGLVFEEPLLFELSRPGRPGIPLEVPDVPTVEPADALGAENVRDDLAGFPELSEPEVVRHFTRLSQWNYGIDSGLYPLGSCTMKYNPKVNERAAALEGFAGRPWQASDLHLVRSVLGAGPGGTARHEPVTSWPLTGDRQSSSGVG